MARTPRNTFHITQHEDMSMTVVHNGEDISELINAIGVEWERQDVARVQVTFIDCHIESN